MEIICIWVESDVSDSICCYENWRGVRLSWATWWFSPIEFPMHNWKALFTFSSCVKHYCVHKQFWISRGKADNVADLLSFEVLSRKTAKNWGIQLRKNYLTVQASLFPRIAIQGMWPIQKINSYIEALSTLSIHAKFQLPRINQSGDMNFFCFCYITPKIYLILHGVLVFPSINTTFSGSVGTLMTSIFHQKIFLQVLPKGQKGHFSGKFWKSTSPNSDFL